MKLGIMQPYFFPYLGYFSLIKHTDKWIVFDSVQYIRHGWIERNRILKPQEGWQYISVPLKKHTRETLIKDIRINNDEDWTNKIIRQLEHYKKKAPYYKNVMTLLDKIFQKKYDSIVNLDVTCLAEVCIYLQINFNYSIYSELNLQIEQVNKPDEWALNICKALKASEYINLPGGIQFFNRDKFIDQKINISFQNIILNPYNQYKTSFIPGLSIIDVMMFNSKEKIRDMLGNVEYL